VLGFDSFIVVVHDIQFCSYLASVPLGALDEPMIAGVAVSGCFPRGILQDVKIAVVLTAPQLFLAVRYAVMHSIGGRFS
jgi:hypothetical protein